MAGFGGSARLALLTGMVSGINNRRDKQREIERQNVLNDQAKQMIAESAARVKNYDFQQKRKIEADQRAAEAAALEAAQEAEARALRERNFDRMARDLAAQIPDMTEEGIRAILAQGGDDIIDDLLRRSPDPMTQREIAQTASTWQDVKRKQMENQLDDELQDLRRDPRFANFRRAVTQRDREAYERMADELRRDYPLGLDSWLDDNLPDNNAPLTPNERAAARATGEVAAAYWIQKYDGDPIAALAAFNKFQAANPPQSQEDKERDNTIRRQLNDAVNDKNKGGGGGSSATSLDVGRLRGESGNG